MTSPLILDFWTPLPPPVAPGLALKIASKSHFCHPPPSALEETLFMDGPLVVFKLQTSKRSEDRNMVVSFLTDKMWSLEHCFWAYCKLPKKWREKYVGKLFKQLTLVQAIASLSVGEFGTWFDVGWGCSMHFESVGCRWILSYVLIWLRCLKTANSQKEIWNITK